MAAALHDSCRDGQAEEMQVMLVCMQCHQQAHQQQLLCLGLGLTGQV